jgi:hypothetical protein
MQTTGRGIELRPVVFSLPRQLPGRVSLPPGPSGNRELAGRSHDSRGIGQHLGFR